MNCARAFKQCILRLGSRLCLWQVWNGSPVGRWQQMRGSLHLPWACRQGKQQSRGCVQAHLWDSPRWGVSTEQFLTHNPSSLSLVPRNRRRMGRDISLVRDPQILPWMCSAGRALSLCWAHSSIFLAAAVTYFSVPYSSRCAAAVSIWASYSDGVVWSLAQLCLHQWNLSSRSVSWGSSKAVWMQPKTPNNFQTWKCTVFC